MLYVEAPNPIPEDAPRPFIFLAGGITDCPDWQSKIVELLGDVECTVLNPRRANFPMGDPDAGRVQIKWEFDMLWQKTEIFSMWFSNGSIGPICLLELGAHLARHRVSLEETGCTPYAGFIVGGDEDYSRRFDVETQSALFLNVDPEECALHTTLEEHAEAIKQCVEQYHEHHEYSGYDDDEEPEEDDADAVEDDTAEDSEEDEQDEGGAA